MTQKKSLAISDKEEKLSSQGQRRKAQQSVTRKKSSAVSDKEEKAQQTKTKKKKKKLCSQ